MRRFDEEKKELVDRALSDLENRLVAPVGDKNFTISYLNCFLLVDRLYLHS